MRTEFRCLANNFKLNFMKLLPNGRYYVTCGDRAFSIQKSQLKAIPANSTVEGFTISVKGIVHVYINHVTNN